MKLPSRNQGPPDHHDKQKQPDSGPVKVMTPLIRTVLPLGWSAMILLLSLTSNPPSTPGILAWDKVLHVGAYSLLTILLAQYLIIYTGDSRRAGRLTIVLVVLFGGVLEVLQGTGQAGRSAEWGDLAADGIGAAAGYFIFRCAVMALSRSSQREVG